MRLINIQNMFQKFLLLQIFQKRFLNMQNIFLSLHTVDPDLYNVAMRIGSEVRSYGFMEDLH